MPRVHPTRLLPLLLLALSFGAEATPTFTVYFGTTTGDYPRDISADGDRVLFDGGVYDRSSGVFYPGSGGRKISADGSAVFKNFTLEGVQYVQRWNVGAGSFGPLFSIPGPGFLIDAVSGDGLTLAPGTATLSGTTFSGNAWIWSNGVGPEPIANPPGVDWSWMADMSFDGSVMAGNLRTPAGNFPARYTSAEGFVPLTSEAGARAQAISADGSTIVGDAFGYFFRWQAGTGSVLLDRPGEHPVVVQGVSGDGRLIVGYERHPSGDRALLWDEQHGTRLLEDVLEQAGVDLGGRSLTRAVLISDDGRVIAGRLTNSAFFAVIPEPSTGLLVAAGLGALVIRRRVQLRADGRPS